MLYVNNEYTIYTIKNDNNILYDIIIIIIIVICYKLNKV